jgi:hypothetical protein
MSNVSENSLIGADLCQLAILLNSHGLCSDISPLEKAGQSCMWRDDSTPWSYTLDKIAFTATQTGGLATDAGDISVSLSMAISGKSLGAAQVENPLDSLCFDIEIEGRRKRKIPEEIKTDFLYAAWHLDKHSPDPKDGETTYSHPLYHLHFGGKRMEAKGYDFFGNAIILDSPRLLYPPMDAVLGIDFILQNYIGKGFIEELIKAPEYVTMVKKSQERLWKPFYTSLYSHWDPKVCQTEESFTPAKLFPLYC